jgi:uncharacterized protein (TIGR02996 family)
MQESAFLAQLKDHPGDVASLLVYADWLTDQGEERRAEFLRLQDDMLTRWHGDGALPYRVRRIQELARGLPEDWLAVVSRPRLDGTVWAGVDSDGDYEIYRYLPTRVLSYTTPSGSFENGTWKQVGPVVLMEMNNHYADYSGAAARGRIVGKARNVVKKKWGWDVSLTTEADARRNAPYRARLRGELPPLGTRKKRRPPEGG